MSDSVSVLMLKTRQEPDKREKSDDSQFEKKPNIDSKIFIPVCNSGHGRTRLYYETIVCKSCHGKGQVKLCY